MSQIAPLEIIIPLVAAPICVIVYHPWLTWAIATVSSFACLAIALLLLNTVSDGSVISYAMGNWSAPIGIELRIDTLNAWMLVIVSGISSFALLFAYTSIKQEIAENRIFLFYAGWLLCLTGLLGICITGDAFNVFVFLEISSLSSYMLISMADSPRSLIASFNYLILGTIAGSFILIGIGLLYVMTGTLNMVDISESLAHINASNTVHTAFAFILIGCLLKAAIFPLHYWQPNAYTFAPSAVSVFLAGTATKVSLYVLLRFTFTVFGGEYAFGMMHLDKLLLLMGVAAMLIGSGVAIFQTSLKRLLAWSSIAQLGYIILGIALLNINGITASMLHLFNHALIKASLFMVAGCFIYRIGVADTESLRGIGKRMPYSMLAFVFAGLSLIGVPLTNGFISKWYLILAALDHQAIWLVFAIVISSLLAVIYIGRLIEIMYFSKATVTTSDLKEAPLSLLIPTWMLIFANFYFGINTQFPTEIAHQTATTLLSFKQ